MLERAGLSAAEAVAAATAGPADAFGVEDRGRLARGRIADLLLVAGDLERRPAAEHRDRGGLEGWLPGGSGVGDAEADRVSAFMFRVACLLLAPSVGLAQGPPDPALLAIESAYYAGEAATGTGGARSA